MKFFHPGALFPVLLALIACGCQHFTPAPLEVSATRASLESTPLDVAPVRAFATALSPPQETADFDLADGLSLHEAQAVALWYNLDLRVARLQSDQAKHVAQLSGRWPDPEVGLETGEKVVEGGTKGLLAGAGGVARSWILAESLSITLPLSGRPHAEKRLRESEHEVRLLAVLEAEWETLASVREAWVSWSAAQERARLLDEHLVLLRKVSETAKSLAMVGELAPSSARLLEIEVLHRESERFREAAAEAEAKSTVMQLLGLLPEAPVTLIPAMSVPAPEGVEPRAFEAHPRLVRLRAEYEVAEKRLRLELRKQYPDLVLSPTYTDEQDQTSLTLGVGLPVPLWNSNRQSIAEAEGARAIARSQFMAEYQGLSVDLARAQAALAGSREQRALLLEGVVPRIDEQLSEVMALVQVGEIDVVLLYETLAQALNTKQELLDATVAEAHASSRVSYLAAPQPNVIENLQEAGK